MGARTFRSSVGLVLRRLLPWIVTAGVLAFLLYRYPLAEIRHHMAAGNFLATVPVALTSALASLLFVAYADSLFFSALGRAPFLRVLAGKATTSMLQAFNYGLSTGGYAVWIARCTGSRVRQAVGLVSYVALTDLAALSLVVLITVAVGAAELPNQGHWKITAVSACVFIGVTALALLGPRLLRNRLGDAAFVEPWAKVSKRVFAASLAVRTVNLAVSVLLTFGAMRAFGLVIPFAVVVAYMPILFFIGALPLNVAGLGAVQLAWVALFEPWAPGAQLLAFQFLFHVLVTFGLVLRGLPFTRKVSRELEVGHAGLAPAADATTPAACEPAKP